MNDKCWLCLTFSYSSQLNFTLGVWCITWKTVCRQRNPLRWLPNCTTVPKIQNWAFRQCTLSGSDGWTAGIWCSCSCGKPKTVPKGPIFPWKGRIQFCPTKRTRFSWPWFLPTIRKQAILLQQCSLRENKQNHRQCPCVKWRRIPKGDIQKQWKEGIHLILRSLCKKVQDCVVDDKVKEDVNRYDNEEIGPLAEFSSSSNFIIKLIIYCKHYWFGIQ